MILISLAVSTTAAIFGGAATYAASGSLLLAFAAYAGTGFLAMVAFLMIALLRENFFAESEMGPALYPAE